MSIRYHILYEFKDGPWGGGNQFLKALKKALSEKDAYADDINDADIVLFNSHHFGQDDEALATLYALKQQRPDVPFVHRVDGPIKLVRGYGRMTDNMIFAANETLADATIFQTEWSRENSLKLGMKTQGPVATIMNAPDRVHFYESEDHKRGDKTKIIASSWSANKRKGFDIYQYLDQNLDFDRFAMTFVGNIPAPFQNIQHLEPMDSAKLAETLREHDIYITASINDPCSNALCEGLACGLPALVRNSGGHPELIGDGGMTFEDENDVIAALDTLNDNYDQYKQNIKITRIEEIADQYLAFAQHCIAEKQDGKTISQSDIGRLHKKLKFTRMADRVTSAIARRLGA